jgi:hypothetical protein
MGGQWTSILPPPNSGNGAGGEIHLRGGPGKPYHCLGPLISALQRAGVRRIGFISEPEARISGGDAK